MFAKIRVSKDFHDETISYPICILEENQKLQLQRPQ